CRGPRIGTDATARTADGGDQAAAGQVHVAGQRECAVHRDVARCAAGRDVEVLEAAPAGGDEPRDGAAVHRDTAGGKVVEQVVAAGPAIHAADRATAGDGEGIVAIRAGQPVHAGKGQRVDRTRLPAGHV